MGPVCLAGQASKQVFSAALGSGKCSVGTWNRAGWRHLDGVMRKVVLPKECQPSAGTGTGTSCPGEEQVGNRAAESPASTRSATVLLVLGKPSRPPFHHLDKVRLDQTDAFGFFVFETVS